jgi:hypothetical protein
MGGLRASSRGWRLWGRPPGSSQVPGLGAARHHNLRFATDHKSRPVVAHSAHLAQDVLDRDPSPVAVEVVVEGVEDRDVFEYAVEVLHPLPGPKDIPLGRA